MIHVPTAPSATAIVPAPVQHEIIIDESAPGSLEFVTKLQTLGDIERRDAGWFFVTAEPRKVNRLADQYPQVVMKVELV